VGRELDTELAALRSRELVGLDLDDPADERGRSGPSLFAIIAFAVCLLEALALGLLFWRQREDARLHAHYRDAFEALRPGHSVFSDAWHKVHAKCMQWLDLQAHAEERSRVAQGGGTAGLGAGRGAADTGARTDQLSDLQRKLDDARRRLGEVESTAQQAGATAAALESKLSDDGLARLAEIVRGAAPTRRQLLRATVETDPGLAAAVKGWAALRQEITGLAGRPVQGLDGLVALAGRLESGADEPVDRVELPEPEGQLLGDTAAYIALLVRQLLRRAELQADSELAGSLPPKMDGTALLRAGTELSTWVRTAGHCELVEQILNGLAAEYDVLMPRIGTRVDLDVMEIKDRTEGTGLATGTVTSVLRPALLAHGKPVAGAKALVETAS